MAKITYAADITHPHLWPAHTLEEGIALLTLRITHSSTGEEKRAEAIVRRQQMLDHLARLEEIKREQKLRRP